MAQRKSIDCRDYPSDKGCTLKMSGTEQEVLDAAVQLFIQRGFHATTIESIAAAADVSVETVYKRFGSKAGILKAEPGTALPAGKTN